MGIGMGIGMGMGMGMGKRMISALSWVMLLLAPAVANAQASLANIAGTLYASQFAKWSVPQGNAGLYSWTSPTVCQVTSGGTTFQAFSAGTPVLIVDAVPGYSEVVTPIAVTVTGAGCSLSVAPTHIHTSFYMMSATAGLQEAINYANNRAYVVVLTPDWTRAGGTTAMILAASGNAAVSILDLRTSVMVPYEWSGSSYIQISGPTGTAGGDLSGTYPNPKVGAIQGESVAATTPAASDVLVWSTGSADYQVRQLTADDVLPGFKITSFTCSTCTTLEIGYTVPSPTNFTAAYTSTPTSASISDGTNTTTLTTPFTSGSLAYSYQKTVAGSTTFTLTTVGASSQTATQAISWQPRYFGGVGTAGATGATASSTNAVLTGTTGTLTTSGLGATQVGVVFGAYTPSGQKIYLLLTGASHTFKDIVTGFAFAFNAPTAVSFVNQYGVTMSLYLYESTNTLTGTFSILVTS